MLAFFYLVYNWENYAIVLFINILGGSYEQLQKKMAPLETASLPDC